MRPLCVSLPLWLITALKLISLLQLTSTETHFTRCWCTTPGYAVGLVNAGCSCSHNKRKEHREKMVNIDHVFFRPHSKSKFIILLPAWRSLKSVIKQTKKQNIKELYIRSFVTLNNSHIKR